jgi:hypothetical protein
MSDSSEEKKWWERMFAKHAFLKDAFDFSVPEGWEPLVEALLDQISHAAKRWPEVCDIRDDLFVKQGVTTVGELADCEWIERYFAQYPTDPFEGFVVMQVKEKWGELRFYTMNGPNKVDHYVDLAERVSHVTCQVCGKMGAEGVYEGSWFSRRCAEHAPSETDDE